MTQDQPLPGEAAPEKPSRARMAEYWMGGERHSEQDRQVGDQISASYPDVQQVVHAHAAFMRRAITFLRAQALNQIVLIGSSISLFADLQTITQGGASSERVLLVDTDPAEVPFTQARLEAFPSVNAIDADLEEVSQILDKAQVREMIDVSRPLGLIFRAVLPYYTDDAEAYAVVRSVRDALPHGSYLALTHLTYEHVPLDAITQIEAIYAASFRPIRARNQAQVVPFFDDLELVPPGLVALPLWRPESDNDLLLDRPERSLGLVGMGYKP